MLPSSSLRCLWCVRGAGQQQRQGSTPRYCGISEQVLVRVGPRLPAWRARRRISCLCEHPGLPEGKVIPLEQGSFFHTGGSATSPCPKEATLSQGEVVAGRQQVPPSCPGAGACPGISPIRRSSIRVLGLQDLALGTVTPLAFIVTCSLTSFYQDMFVSSLLIRKQVKR